MSSLYTVRTPEGPKVTSYAYGRFGRRKGSWHRLATLFAVCLTGVILNGCAQQGGESAPVGPEPNESAKTDTVVMVDVAFHPETLKVRAGDTVVFINRDIVDHDVTDHDDDAYASGTLKPGDVWKHVFESDANYYCSLHVIMEGRIEVVKNED